MFRVGRRDPSLAARGPAGGEPRAAGEVPQFKNLGGHLGRLNGSVLVDSRLARNRRFLTDLFAGPFRGHAIIVDHEPIPSPFPGDVACPGHPVTDWLDHGLRSYEAEVQTLEEFDDDNVPCVRIGTGTQVFAAAFGCPVHLFEGSNAAALPLVTTADEADALPQPDPHAPPLDRVYEYGRLMRERLGPEAPIRVPDIQSPFDIAALVWRKEALFLAMMDRPDAVKRLVAKCHELLKSFLTEFRHEFADGPARSASFAHCPNAWAPPELGCWLSEDEAGAMSTAMFEEFCLPSLTDLSETFGGLFVHCCATADHQYGSFKKIPNLRGMNRVFQAPGPRPAIEAFSGQAVLMVAWTGEQQAHEMLDMALPNTRFLFNLPYQPLDEAKRTYARLRERCPRG
jgi:hypothetical protein